MKLRLMQSVLIGGLILCSAASTLAYTVTVPAGGYSFVGFPFTNNAVQNAITNPCDQTQVIRWGGGGWTYNTYDAVWGWDSPSDVIRTAEGFFIHNASTNNYTYAVTGTPLGTNTSFTMLLSAGTTNALSYAYDVNLAGGNYLECFTNPCTSTNLSVSLGYSGHYGDTVYLWNGSGWDAIFRYDCCWGGNCVTPKIPENAGFLLVPGQTNIWTHYDGGVSYP